MKTEILNKLHEIEEMHDIRILLAVESGSRAWGFASPDSDYDVRFVYVHRPQWYFKVSNERDTIEYMSDDGIMDFSGWELRKTLQLLRKTNPSLSDWLMTDCIYLANNDFLDDMRTANREYYNPIHAIYHYFSIARNHDNKYLSKNGCTLKKFLYFLRGLLACEYIKTYWQHPPVRFSQLVESTVTDNDIKAKIHEIIELKSRSHESDKNQVDASLTAYAYGIYNRLDTEISDFRPDTAIPRDTTTLDAIMWKWASPSHE